MAKLAFISLRVTHEIKEVFERAARGKRMRLSDWLVGLGVRETSVPASDVNTSDSIIEAAPWEIVEDVKSDFTPNVIEAAAKAEPGFGRSVTGFLLDTKKKIADVSPVLAPVVTDPWEARCIGEFGAAVVQRSFRGIPGWKTMTWEVRHRVLAEQKEKFGGNEQ